MNDVWPWIGWVGNACFFSRFLVQWWKSERAGRTVAPRAFWWLSLAGTALLFAYTLHRGELVLLAGFAVNAFLYTRNLQLAYARDDSGPRIGRILTLSFGLLALALLVLIGLSRLRLETTDSRAWLGVGIVGQSVWCSRFVLQWVASENRGTSHFPRAFWWVSLLGNSLLLSYAVHLGDPVWIAGLALGPFVQVRNLMLDAKRRRISEPARRDTHAPRVELDPAPPSS